MQATDPSRLAAIPLFAGLDVADLERIASMATEFNAQAGHVLIEVGRPGSGLFVLEEGTLEVELPGGRTATLEPGTFVGEIALLTDAPHTARVRAATEVRCLAIARADFHGLLEEHPTVAVRMLPVLAARLASVIGASA